MEYDYNTRNRVTDAYGTIGGGGHNQAGDNEGTTIDAKYATVGGGVGNTASESGATVGGGYYNEASGDVATVGGGYGNTASEEATVGGGYMNEASGHYATVSGGDGNTASEPGATVGGGYYNEASGYYATVSGGFYNEASGELATIPGGGWAVANKYGQMAYASGSFSWWGDAQASLYVLRNLTTGTTQKELFLDGSDQTQRILISANQTVTFHILISAQSDSAPSDSAGYKIEGVIKNYAGTTSLIGTPVITELAESIQSWSVVAQADDVSDALVVKVTGSAGKTCPVRAFSTGTYF